MKTKTRIILFGLILIVGILNNLPIWGAEKSPTAQSVAFINTQPYTILGLVKFVVNEKNEPIDYVILYEKWTETKRVLWLEPGLYGITQYAEYIDPRTNRQIGAIVGYQDFWVKDKPVLITM